MTGGSERWPDLGSQNERLVTPLADQDERLVDPQTARQAGLPVAPRPPRTPADPDTCSRRRWAARRPGRATTRGPRARAGFGPAGRPATRSRPPLRGRRPPGPAGRAAPRPPSPLAPATAGHAIYSS